MSAEPSQSTEIFSFLAVAFSGIALYVSYKNYQVQSQLVRDAKKNAKKAELCAALVKEGRQFCLHIWNQGNAPARNVRFKSEATGRVFIRSDVDTKFPIKELPVGKEYPVKLIASITLGSIPKYDITLTWDDDWMDNHKKQITVVL